jgi:hypothetical protein
VKNERDDTTFVAIFVVAAMFIAFAMIVSFVLSRCSNERSPEPKMQISAEPSPMNLPTGLPKP